MPTDSKILNLTLYVDVGEDADADELDRLTRQLRAEMQELEVESVELVKEDSVPDGAKPAEAVTLGALAVAILPSIVPKVIEFLQAWSMRTENRAVKVKTQIGDRSLEVEYSPTTMSQDELKHLVETLTDALTPEEE